MRAASYHTVVRDLSCPLSVRAVFSRAWHLQTADGWIVSVTALPFNGPLGVRLDRSSLHGLSIEPGMRGCLHDGEIVIGPVRVTLSDAVAWNPHPPAPSPTAWAMGSVEEEGIEGGDGVGGWALDGLKPGVTSPRLPLSHAWERGTGDEGRIAVLRQSLCNLDRAAIPQHALALLGLGPGLTPAGDDVLVGLLAGLFVLGHRAPNSPALDIIPLISHAVMEAAPARTTAFSRTMLHYAARGVATEPLLDVLWNLGPEGNVKGLHRLLTIGQSSGRAMLAGAMLALDSVERWEEMGGATLAHPT